MATLKEKLQTVQDQIKTGKTNIAKAINKVYGTSLSNSDTFLEMSEKIKDLGYIFPLVYDDYTQTNSIKSRGHILALTIDAPLINTSIGRLLTTKPGKIISFETTSLSIWATVMNISKTIIKKAIVIYSSPGNTDGYLITHKDLLENATIYMQPPYTDMFIILLP